MNVEMLKVVKRNPFVFPLVCVAVAAMIFISEGSYWRSVATLDELGAMAVARSNIRSLERSVIDAETGQRGYMLTARKEYLQPYADALLSIETDFASLARHYEHDAQASALLSQLRAATQTRLSELALTIRLYDEGRTGAAMEIVLSDIGREKMQATRMLSDELLRLESASVAQGRQDVYHTLQLSRIGIAALSALSLLALVLFLRSNAALEEQQREQQRLMRAERDRLESEVALRTAQLTELMQHVQNAREDERKRLARELHDELGALLTSAKLDAARIRSRLAGTAPEAQERLAHLVDTLNSGIALKRRIIEDLRPSALSNLGLGATLEILAREFAASSAMEVQCTVEPVLLEPAAELVIYRMVQEAITNITKHARASKVWISLSAQGGQAQAEVRDDGVGFIAGSTARSAHGLLGMRFRVEAEGGMLSIESTPGQGTVIKVNLPLATATSEAHMA